VCSSDLRSTLYTDHLIYTPRAPFFRVSSEDPPMEAPNLASVLTSPAPNVRNDDHPTDALRATFDTRIAQVLGVALAHQHETLILGAWGCGAFRNDPELVADCFGRALEGPWRGSFRRVVFAVWEPKKPQGNFDAFARRLATT